MERYPEDRLTAEQAAALADTESQPAVEIVFDNELDELDHKLHQLADEHLEKIDAKMRKAISETSRSLIHRYSEPILDYDHSGKQLTAEPYAPEEVEQIKLLADNVSARIQQDLISRQFEVEMKTYEDTDFRLPKMDKPAFYITSFVITW